MELDQEQKQKIIRKFLKRLGKPVSRIVAGIYVDLLMGKHLINITTRGKFTIAETKFYRCGYIHHFLGVSAKNPNDVADRNYGIKVAVEESLLKLIQKFYFDEIEHKIDF